ncbi:SGNH/GDSL hydrolase family protein [Microbacterium oxydans]|nr:SGNH/GDSL hydrolase family protein [Microbacterium oxydans]
MAIGVWRPWVPAPLAAPISAAAAGESDPSAVIAPAPLVLPENPTVLVFGDSWTYGSAATLPTQGYAYLLADLLGGRTIVDGVRGSGYLKPGIDGPTFGERIAALDPSLSPDLVIMQGSINDRAQGAAGYREAVNAAWDAMAALYPKATIVVLGPAPHELPVGATTARIDTDLAELAAARGWWYISPDRPGLDHRAELSRRDRRGGRPQASVHGWTPIPGREAGRRPRRAARRAHDGGRWVGDHPRRVILSIGTPP